MIYNIPVQNKQTLYIVSLLVVMLYVFLNIYASQATAPEFSGIVYKNNRNLVVSYLQKITKRDEFADQLKIYSSIYGENIVDDVVQPHKKLINEIDNYTSILKKNPNSRDVLYKLALLYREDKNEIKAQEYYSKALEIDPQLIPLSFP